MNISLDDIFKNEIKGPFFYNLDLSNINNNVNKNNLTEKIFEKFTEIFKKGLSIVTGSSNNILQIENIKIKDIELVRKHMLSLGIEVKYKNFDDKDKDYYIRKFIYAVEKLDNIIIKLTLNSNDQFIKKVDFTLNNKVLPEFNKIASLHREANYFLSIVKPKNLKDYLIKCNKKNSTFVIYFDYANRIDYQYHHPYCDQFSKHVK